MVVGVWVGVGDMEHSQSGRTPQAQTPAPPKARTGAHACTWWQPRSRADKNQAGRRGRRQRGLAKRVARGGVKRSQGAHTNCSARCKEDGWRTSCGVGLASSANSLTS